MPKTVKFEKAKKKSSFKKIDRKKPVRKTAKSLRRLRSKSSDMFEKSIDIDVKDISESDG
jgi:hypothetical protein